MKRLGQHFAELGRLMKTRPDDVEFALRTHSRPDVLRSRIERNLEDANRIIEAYGGSPLNVDEIFDEMSR